jgi:hypothetical protein
MAAEKSVSMKYRYVWVTTMACFFSHRCIDATEKRLLAVGGIHIFERQMPCRLVSAEPEDSVKDLNWTYTLALEAMSEGTAELTCGVEQFRLEIVLPTRLDIEVVSDVNPANMPVLEHFKVRQPWTGTGGWKIHKLRVVFLQQLRDRQ